MHIIQFKVRNVSRDLNLYSRDALSAYRCTIGTHMMNCWTDVLKDFDSRTEEMGLKFPCGSAEGMHKRPSFVGPDPSSHKDIIACSTGTYTASDSAPARNMIWPCETINDCANI